MLLLLVNIGPEIKLHHAFSVYRNLGNFQVEKFYKKNFRVKKFRSYDGLPKYFNAIFLNTWQKRSWHGGV